MYGRIHYENEAGEFRTLDCPDQWTYERELNIGCKWIEAEPQRPLGMWGERLDDDTPHNLTLTSAAGQRHIYDYPSEHAALYALNQVQTYGAHVIYAGLLPGVQYLAEVRNAAPEGTKR